MLKPKSSVRKFSMGKFITHEAVAAGAFARDYAPANTGVWEATLTNNENVLDYLLQRVEKDFMDLHVKQRKPWVAKDLVP